MKITLVSADRTTREGYPSNLGDAFLTDRFVAALTNLGHTVSAVDFGGVRSDSEHSRIRVTGLLGLIHLVRASDAIVLGGGTLLQDDTPNTRFGGLPRLCLTASALGWFFRKPVFYFGVGCDSIQRPAARAILRLAVWKRAVWVRDEHSSLRFARYFGRTPQLAADVSLLSPPSDSTRVSTSQATRPVSLAPNRRDVAQITPAVVESIGAVRLLAMDQRPDVGDLAGSAAFPPTHPFLTADQVDWMDVMDVIAGSSAVIASRMHALYIAAVCGVPMIAIGQSDKLVAFAEEFGVPLVKSFDEVVVQSARQASGSAVEAARARVEAALLHLDENLNARASRDAADRS